MPPTLRPRKGQNKSEKTKSKAAKQVRNSRKRKREDEAKDTVDGPNSDSTRKQFRSSDDVDGGPVSAYPMARRGPVFIINNYAGHENFAYRQGSFADVGKLTDCFQTLGFHSIDVNYNLTCDMMKEHFKSLADSNYSEDDCIVIAILSHGSSSGDVPDGIVGADGKSVAVGELLKPFRKYIPSLVGKPKIFIIQTCRGPKISVGIREPNAITDETNVNASTSWEPSVSSHELFTHPKVRSSGYLPLEADQLIAFATGDGHVAYRDTSRGSWYIDDLTEALYEEYKRKGRKNRNSRHLVDIVTEVQGMVSNRIKEKFQVQMPEFRSTLRGPIYL